MPTNHADATTPALRAAELIAQADSLVIAAGAGMGVDSGLPDFRGNAGFWKAYPALARTGTDFTDVASPGTFARDPRLAWGFYGHRLQLYRRTLPHEGYAVLARWAAAMRHGSFVFTSNVDGQFQRAGYATGRIHECHGSIHQLQCTRPCGDAIWPADDLVPDIDAARCQWLGELPACPHCGALARPNILMFHDGRWNEGHSAQQEAQLGLWLQQAGRPVVVEIGAGTQIASVRIFGEEVVRHHGGRLVRINPREFAVSSAQDVGLPSGALDGLRAIDELLAPRR